MKIKIGQLKKVIREEYIQGVPEWQLREDAKEFVDRIRSRITKFIMINKSQNMIERQEAVAAMNEICDQLEQQVYEILEDKLYAFTLRV